MLGIQSPNEVKDHDLRRLVSLSVYFLMPYGVDLEKLELYLTRELVWRSEYNERNGTKESYSH